MAQIAALAGQELKNKQTGDIVTAEDVQTVSTTGDFRGGQFFNNEQFEIVKPQADEPMQVEDFDSPEPKIPEQEQPSDVDFDGAKKTLTVAEQSAKDINDFINRQTDAEKERAELRTRLEEGQESVLPKADRLAEERDRLGVSEQQEKLRGINQQIAQLQAGLDLGIAQEEARPIARQFITGRTAEMRRQATAEIGSLATIALAIQGNIAGAKAQAKETVDLEFAAEEQEILNVTELLRLNYQDLTRADQKKAVELTLKLQDRQAQIDKEKEFKRQKTELYLKAAARKADLATLNNIRNAETIEDAAMAGAEYLGTPADTVIVDIGDNKLLINKSTGATIKNLGVSDASTLKLESIDDGFGNKIYGTFDGTKFTPISVPNSAVLGDDDLSSAITSAISTAGFTADTRKAVLGSIMAHLKNGNIEAAKQSLETGLRNNASTGEQEKIGGWDDSFKAIESIEAGLNELKGLGVDTNFWVGLSEKQLNKIGETTNTDVARIKAKVAMAIINYRKAVSGAAFTESEAKEYEAIFPSVGNVEELNDALITNLKETFRASLDNWMKRKVGDYNYDTIFGTTSTMPQLPPLTQSYASIDELVADVPEYAEYYNWYLEQDPNATDDDIMSDLERINGSTTTSGFNQDLSKSQKGKIGKENYLDNLGKITAYGSEYWAHGLDIDLQVGDPVPTPEAGEVIFVGKNGGFGNQVKIRTAKGNEIWLSHLDSIDVQVGDRLVKNQFVGGGGKTGSVIPVGGGDGSHLDLTVKKPDGSFYSPEEIYKVIS
jgi:murein DD-endopeptidase MepM/ murein hydrolase activator NlpD